METNLIYNEDCLTTISKMGGGMIDIVLTSPPYNTERISGNSEKSRDRHYTRYDVYESQMSDEEYCNWNIKLFESFDNILSENGIVLYNISYCNDGHKTPSDMLSLVLNIEKNTCFTVADIICWKKSSALPNNVSPNKLTRITEFVFVFCRKGEFNTFRSGKTIKSTSSTGQQYYTNVCNFIEAPNNDGSCNLNKATFSSSLVEQLLEMYCGKTTNIVYDPFMGTGTTAIGCINYNNTHAGKKAYYIGSEISSAQCEYADKRINDTVGKCVITYSDGTTETLVKMTWDDLL